MKTVNELKDMQGKTLAVGDRVAMSSYHNPGLVIGIVEKLNRVRVVVRPVKCQFSEVVDTVETVGSDELIKL